MSEPAQIQPPSERLPCVFVDPPHPATWGTEQLRADIDVRTQSRSGPGGQHRNRTASGAFVSVALIAGEGSRSVAPGHRVTITAEATEQRHQGRNKALAIQRLRYALALGVRTASALDPDQPPSAEEDAVRQCAVGTALKLNEANEAKPAVLAMLLNDLLAAGGQPSLVAAHWRVSTSRLVACLRSHPPAWTWVNRVRGHHRRPPLH